MAKQHTKEEYTEFYNKFYAKLSNSGEAEKIRFDSPEGIEAFTILFFGDFKPKYKPFKSLEAEYLLELNPDYAKLFTRENAKDFFLSALNGLSLYSDNCGISFLLEKNSELIEFLNSDEGKEEFKKYIEKPFFNPRSGNLGGLPPCWIAI